MSNNRTIASNTIYLYIRMIVLMLVKLYTSRILLQTLGIDDYGVWNAVASFIVAFSFISSPLVSATQRFLNYEMGKSGNKLNEIFCTSLIIFTCAAVVIVILLETIGLWFVNNKMTFGITSMWSVHVLYQLSIIALIVTMLKMPYEAVIIANENMSFYSKISILEGILLLTAVFLLQIPGLEHKLVMYGGLTLVCHLLVFSCYRLYCTRRFECAKFRFVFNKKLAKEIGVFSGWNFFGAMSSMTATQGVNILLNMFYGVAYNATYGISNQMRAAVSSIVDNLQKASNPQIVKSYAADDRKRVYDLVINVGKFSFLLVFALSVPVMINMPYILTLWLGKDLPPDAVYFCNLALVQLLFVCYTAPMDTAIFATGNIRTYQLTLSGIILLNILLVYIAFKCGLPAITAMYIKAGVEAFVLIARIIFLNYKIGLSIRTYLKKMISPCLIVMILSLTLMYAFMVLVGDWQSELLKLITSSITFILIAVSISWLVAFNHNQRTMILTMAKNRISR